MKLLMLLMSLMIIFNATANDRPYTGQEQRSIKALSPKEVEDLKAGRGMGLSKVAELNHLPGPLHVIELADKLHLSTQQKTEAQSTFDTMSGEAKKLGAAIVAKEADLEKLFLQPSVEAAKVQQLVSEIAALQGQLRFVHINAHIKMARTLTPHQIAMYDNLRGYTGENAGHGHQHHKHH